MGFAVPVFFVFQTRSADSAYWWVQPSSVTCTSASTHGKNSNLHCMWQCPSVVKMTPTRLWLKVQNVQFAAEAFHSIKVASYWMENKFTMKFQLCNSFEYVGGWKELVFTCWETQNRPRSSCLQVTSSLGPFLYVAPPHVNMCLKVSCVTSGQTGQTRTTGRAWMLSLINLPSSTRIASDPLHTNEMFQS